jgi:heptosyltransferase II
MGVLFFDSRGSCGWYRKLEKPVNAVWSTPDDLNQLPFFFIAHTAYTLASSKDAQMRIAVFLPNWVGDVVMATPTLRALRKHFGSQAELIGIHKPYVSDVLTGSNWFDRTVHYDRRSKDSAHHTWPLIKALRGARPDAAVLLPNSLRAAAIARLAGIPTRVGYVRYGRGLLLTRKLYHARSGRSYLPTPAIDAYLQLAYALGCPAEASHLELETTPADEAKADDVWRRLQLPPGEQVVVLNSGGAYGAAKHWPAEHFAALAKRIALERHKSVLVLCGPAERNIAREIAHRAAHPHVVSLADEGLSLGLSKVCVRRSALLVTTDSGPRFFGIAFGKPVVTLFGPTHPRWSTTHDPREIELQHKVPCGPCSRRRCPLGHHQCMRDLRVERVFAAVSLQLDYQRRAQAA